jgi:hypothetical protein
MENAIRRLDGLLKISADQYRHRDPGFLVPLFMAMDTLRHLSDSHRSDLIDHLPVSATAANCRRSDTGHCSSPR